MQLSNSALAILQILQQLGWDIGRSIATGMAKTSWPGIQWTTWQNQRIDGAHNPAAAQAPRQFVDTLDTRP